MKYLKCLLVLMLVLCLPSLVKAYDYVNSNNQPGVTQGRQSVYDLYDLYEELFPDPEDDDSCSATTYGTVYAQCKGVTVSGMGTYSLEDYVAGVLGPEFGSVTDNEEAAKAFAIAIRSYTLHRTNNCTQTITASSNDQNFSKDIKTYKKYVDMTSGIVMTNKNGIVSGTYSLAYAGDCNEKTSGICTFKRCTEWTDNLNSCGGKWTYNKVPKGVITYQNHDIHYGGLEPYIARYKAIHENYTAEQILKAFYGNDIKLATLEGVDNGDKKNGQESSSSKESDNKSEETTNISSSEVLVDKSKYKLKTKKLKVTTYTGQASENGGYAGKIALSDVNGGKLADGMIAVRLLSNNKTWIPYHTVVYVETQKKGEGSYANGKFFYVADNGGLTQNAQIDVYCAKCDEQNKPSMANSAPYGTYNKGKLYIVEKNVTWKEYLNKYYTKKAVKANSTSTDSDTKCNVDSNASKDDNSEYVNVNGVSFPVKNYNIEGSAKGLGKYFNLNASNVSQCPWYAKYRAIEIIMTSSLKKSLKNKAKSVLNATSGNGNQWYAGTNSTLKYFKYSNDLSKPKAGSIVSWNMNSHGYGHVGIVEKVYSDGSMLISEGWNRNGPDSGNSVSAIKIITRKMTQSEVKTYNGKGSFIGYTYLFSYKS